MAAAKVVVVDSSCGGADGGVSGSNSRKDSTVVMW